MASVSKGNFHSSAIRSQIIISIDVHCMVNMARLGIKEVDKDFDVSHVSTSGPRSSRDTRLRLAFPIQADTFNSPAIDLGLGSRPAKVLASGFCSPIFTVCLPLE